MPTTITLINFVDCGDVIFDNAVSSSSTSYVLNSVSLVTAPSITNAAGRNFTMTSSGIGCPFTNQGTVKAYGFCNFKSFTNALNASFSSLATGINTLSFDGGFTNHGGVGLACWTAGNTTKLMVTNGTLQNANDGALRTDASSVGTVEWNGDFSNAGLVEVRKKTTLKTTAASTTNIGGTIHLIGEYLTIDQPANAIFTNGYILNLDAGTTLNVLAGTLDNDGSFVLGSGTIDVTNATFESSGLIGPGASPGQLLVTGDLTLKTNSILDIELGGTTVGTGYDRLTVSGNVKLAGTLRFRIINGFVPAAGNIFKVVTYGNHTGTFSRIDGADLGNNLSLAATSAYPGYSANEVEYVVVRQAWTQVAAGGTPPAARRGHSAILDATNNRMTIFGGRTSGGVQNDVWVLTNANGIGVSAWTQLSPTGTPPSARQGQSAVYDAAGNRMIVFGGDNAASPPVAKNDVWVLSHANGLGGTPAWTQLSPTNAPPGLTTRHLAFYNQTTNRMIVFGGATSGNCGAANAINWLLSNANGVGTPNWNLVLTNGTRPSPRAGMAGAYDPVTNRLMVYGGAPSCGIIDGGTWILPNADASAVGTPTWSELPLLNDPAPPVIGARAVFDAAANRMMTFGGAGTDGITLTNKVTLFDEANGAGGVPSWGYLPPPTSQPTARQFHSAVYDAANRRMTIFGGALVSSTLLNEVWVLNVSGGNGQATDVPPELPAVSNQLLRAPWPNPTSGEMSFVLDMPVEEAVSVALFDVAGRKVSTLFEGTLGAGSHELHWDGRNGDGSAAASGIYFLRVRTHGRRATRRVILAR